MNNSRYNYWRKSFKTSRCGDLSKVYHRFRWYATLENKTPAETFPKFPSVLRVIDRSDRNPPIQPDSMTKRRLEGHTSGWNWCMSIRSVNNAQDWRKFWKRFRGCFLFQSRVSTKTVVRDGAIPVSTDKYIFTRSVKWENFTWRELNQTVSLISDKHISAISRRKFKQMPLLD